MSEHKPDWVSSPWETVWDIFNGKLDDLHHIQDLICKLHAKEKGVITPEIASALEEMLDAPAHFWLNREKQYREALSEQTKD